MSVLDRIGATPLVEIRHPDLPPGSRLFAKLESTNPGGSIKDRPVARMIRGGIERGKLRGGRRILDSSSGNAGIAYAMLGSLLELPVTLVVPANASRERLARIAAHGAELILTDAVEGYDEALRHARRLARRRPDRYWHVDQYENDDNWRAHHEGTGPEIVEQVTRAAGTPPDAFVAGVGTGGTITGVGRYLRGLAPTIGVHAVAPETFPGIEGLKPLGNPGDIEPGILDRGLIDSFVPVTSERAAEEARRLARSGLFVGPSSGAFVAAAVTVAAERGYRSVVTVLSDTGERYASTGLWETPVPAYREVS